MLSQNDLHSTNKTLGAASFLPMPNLSKMKNPGLLLDKIGIIGKKRHRGNDNVYVNVNADVMSQNVVQSKILCGACHYEFKTFFFHWNWIYFTMMN